MAIFGILALCQCECDKSYGIEEYLDYKNCVCRNSIIYKLAEESTSVIDENNIYNETLDVTLSNLCASSTLYVVLFPVFLTASVIIGSSVIHFCWYKKNKQLNSEKNNVHNKFNPSTQTTIY